jgi:RNA polymerase sigma factor (sigma-70 family)
VAIHAERPLVQFPTSGVGADVLPLLLGDSGPCSPDDEEWGKVGVALRRISRLRVRNRQDAEDLVQDAFLTMVAKHRGVELKKGLLVWGLGILRNKIGNYYRRRRHEVPWGPANAPPRRNLEGSTRGSNPEAEVLGIELAALVASLLEHLSPDERVAVELLLEGLRVREIAFRLRPQTYQNVANHLCRGRKKIARRLARLGYARRGWHSLPSRR